MFSRSNRTIVNHDKFVKGIRVKNQSVRIYETNKSKYLVVHRKYLFGACISYKEEIVDDIYTAEDHLSTLKLQRK